MNELQARGHMQSMPCFCTSRELRIVFTSSKDYKKKKNDKYTTEVVLYFTKTKIFTLWHLRKKAF